MKIKTMLCVFGLIILALVSYAQEEKISVSFTQQPLSGVIKTLFADSSKNYTFERGLSNGYITLSVKDTPFNQVLSMILKQVSATYEYKDGVYIIKPDYNAMQGAMGGMQGGMAGGMGMQPGMAGPMGGGMAGGMGMQPGMAGGMGMQPGMAGGMGMQPGMAGGMGMNGQQVSTVNYKDQKIKAIKINYNSPNQILSLMDGDDYIDVVYYGSGSSGNSGSSDSSSSSSSNSGRSSGSSSSRSSNR